MATQTEQQGYQGWSNYETWAVALWFGNDQGMYNLSRDTTRGLMSDAVTEKENDRAALKLADWIKEYVQNNNPLRHRASIYSDLLSAAISDTNWYEIAKAWIEDFT